MGIQVLIEPTESGFRAATGPPLELQAEAPTRESARARIAELVEERMRGGAEVDSIEIPTVERHPLEDFIGDMRDDALFDEWQQAIRDYRAEAERREW